MRKEKRKSLGAVTHTHKTFTKETESKPILWWNPSTRQSVNLKRENSSRLKVLKLNLSATMMVAGAIVFVILAIVAVRMIVTAINSSSQKALAEEETKGYSLVDSTDVDEEGNVIDVQVPVPDGFTASQVPGETTVNGGFVIYEGEVDWSKIENLDSYAEVATQEEETNTSSENSSITENTNSEDTNADGIGTNTEGTSEGEEKSNIEAGSNTGSNTNSNETEESANSAENSEIKDTEKEEQTEGDADVSEETEQGIAQGENITNGEEDTQKEGASDSENGENGINGEGESQVNENEETETTEEEKGEQENKEILSEEEEAISNEEAGLATMSEEGDGGIATLAEGETPTTVFELQTSTNQYVWVPVKDVSRIYGIASNGKLWGKLYEEYNVNERTALNWKEIIDGAMSIISLTGYNSHREPDVIIQYSYGSDINFFDADSKLQSQIDGMKQYQMLSQEMEESFYKMIESVKKYGGFYIGRYETGNLNQPEAVVKKMNTDINIATWYEMYELSKNLEGEKENIETSMIWGSLWDETLQWLLESNAKISTGEVIDYTRIGEDSVSWGNYNDATFEYTNKSGGIRTKYKGSSTEIPTGGTEYTKANNIYDLAGNMREWTLEALHAYERVFRGGAFSFSGHTAPVNCRYYDKPTYSDVRVGCRAVLLIK